MEVSRNAQLLIEGGTRRIKDHVKKDQEKRGEAGLFKSIITFRVLCSNQWSTLLRVFVGLPKRTF